MGRIAQLVEQRTFNPKVLGSNPNMPKINLSEYLLIGKQSAFQADNMGSSPITHKKLFFNAN